MPLFLNDLRAGQPRRLYKTSEYADVSQTPVPDYHLLVRKKYAFMNIQISRGCPFSCSFCSTKVHWNRFRAHSAERVVEEMELVVNKYNVEILHLFDDLFTANKKRLFKIRDLMVEKGLNKRVRMMCLVRSDTTDDEIMQALKEMNIVVIGAGFESMSKKMLKYIKKDTTTVEQHKRLADLAIKYQIPLMASFLIGNPGETMEDLQETLEFIRSYRHTRMFQPLSYVAAVFPGTEYYDIAKQRNLPVDDYERILMDIVPDINAFKNAPLLTDLPLEDFYKIAQEFQYETVLKIT